jgi:hypothetical protein
MFTIEIRTGKRTAAREDYHHPQIDASICTAPGFLRSSSSTPVISGKWEAVLKPLRAYGNQVGDAVGPMPYTAVQRISDPVYGKCARNIGSLIFQGDIGRNDRYRF